MADPEFTLGIEEEFLVVDREDHSLVHDPAIEFYEACRKRLGKQVSQEMMRSQIEVATKVHANVAKARSDLARLRRNLIANAEKQGFALISAGTHPFADWSEAIHTEKDRYEQVANDLRAVGRRLVISGLHVHVGSFTDKRLRVDLMNRVMPFLPLVLALSTSSPFWHGENTGLKCYRLAVYDALPRTGFPEIFADDTEYDDFVDTLSEAGIIPDSSMVWWAIRPSGNFPTVEMRIPDACTRIDDSITMAAFYQCLIRHLYYHPEINRDYVGYRRLFVDENRWRAQRYGTDCSMLDWRRRCLVPFATLLEETLTLLEPDATALGCEEELDNARAILRRGTSAHAQRRIHGEAINAGSDSKTALRRVVRWLETETARNL